MEYCITMYNTVPMGKYTSNNEEKNCGMPPLGELGVTGIAWAVTRTHSQWVVCHCVNSFLYVQWNIQF